MSQQNNEGSELATKMKDQGQVLDRISGLPDEVLGHILSFLPTKATVATSILSTRWRYLFGLTTCLYFEDLYETGCTSEAERKAHKDSFKKFVYLVLLSHHKSPIVEFGLDCQNTYGSSHLDVWITAAIQKKVRKLYLKLVPFDFRKEQWLLPYTFFNSKSLEVIEITADSDLDVPKTVCLPSLKVLHLKLVRIIDRDSIERFFCGCTALEVLTLDNCELGEGDAWFHSATLKELTVMRIFSTEMIKVDAPNLGYVRFVYYDDFFSMDPYESPPSFGCLKDESTVTHLSLHENSFALVPFYEFPAFPNLAVLELSWCPVEEQYWDGLIGLICRSPRLEAVIFRQGLIKHVDGDDQLEKCLRGLGVSMSMHLEVEVIEVHCFPGNERDFILLEYLLRMNQNLKWLILYKDCNMKMEQELSIAKKLLNLPRISDHCRIRLV